LKNLDHQILLEAFILLISFHAKAFKVVVVWVVQTFHCIFILEAMCPRQVPFDAHSISGLVQKICYGPLPIAAASADYSLNCELKTHWVIVLETIPDVRRFQTLIRTSYDGHLDAGSNSLDHFGTSELLSSPFEQRIARSIFLCWRAGISSWHPMFVCLFVRSFVCLHISHILGRLIDYISPCLIYNIYIHIYIY